MINKKWAVFSPLLLLLIPLIGMLFSNEVNWSFFDFIIMGILILVMSFGIKLVLKTTPKRMYRILIIGIILILFLLVWAELAVGVFETPFAGS
ncbi:hypothetical protein GENT5_06060 [Flavobacterium ammoniigenes]|jgi:hypothetical protein|uniref:Uncharacterized protein n=1 Tax=Flavobacterium ammoniigenes TaxID=1751095 RepID=A0ABM7V450_9FLAO|nr:hypothetical protein [Flavobacterium ammoniigenes]BDB54301.1 hypothetical protein GENT5_06060 [Flavobacterium ammoniigenes]